MKGTFNLNQAVRVLPPFAQAEVYDFVSFLQHKYVEAKEPVVREEGYNSTQQIVETMVGVVNSEF